MADFDDIRRGLAANLAALRPDGFQVALYLLDSPTAPTLQVAGITEIDYDVQFRGTDGYDLTGDKQLVRIEAAIPWVIDVGAQKILDKLHGPSSLKAAVESDDHLTSRLQDDGTIDISQEPACDALRVTRYLGANRTTLESESGGVDAVLAVWEVELYT